MREVAVENPVNETPATVLIADDDMTLRILAREVLEQAGYVVAEAEDGAEALASFERIHPHLVILDVSMPRLDGFSVCSAVRSHPGGDMIPILMMTGMDDLASINRAYEVGATDFLPKPVNLPLLAHRVHYLLRGSRTVSELRRSEVNNRALLEAIPDCMFRISSDGVLIDSRIPKGPYPMWDPETIHGQNIIALLAPEVAQQVNYSLTRAFQTTAMEFFEYQIYHSGEPHYHEARIVVCGEHEALVMVRDITIRKKTEAALKESEGKYKCLYESSRDAIMLLDPENGLLGGNPASISMLGCADEADLVAKTPITFSPEYQPDGVPSASKARMLAALALQNGSHFSEWKCRRQDGTEFFASVLLNKVALNGKPVLQATLRDISEQKQAEEELKRTLQRLRKAVDGTIQVIAATVELRDPYTAGHQRRVSDLASEIAHEMGLTPQEVDEIRMASLIHDLGKIAIPSDILSKPGKLLDMEFNLIKTHPLVAYNILKDAEIPYYIAKIVLQHHEKMNGSGYPHGVSGEEILVGSRIVGVADVVEAMASHRPYRPSLGVEKALEEIERNRGILYDAEVVDTCVKLFKEKGFTLK